MRSSGGWSTVLLCCGVLMLSAHGRANADDLPGLAAARWTDADPQSGGAGRLALLVGVGVCGPGTEGALDLASAVPSVEHLRDVLVDDLGYAADDVRVVTSAPGDGGAPRRDVHAIQIRAAIRSLVSRASGVDNTLVLYWVGHGVTQAGRLQLLSAFSRPAEGGYDNLIAYDDLTSWIQSAEADRRRDLEGEFELEVAALVDACRTSDRGAPTRLLAFEPAVDLEAFASPRGMPVLDSGRPEPTDFVARLARGLSGQVGRRVLLQQAVAQAVEATGGELPKRMPGDGVVLLDSTDLAAGVRVRDARSGLAVPDARIEIQGRELRAGSDGRAFVDGLVEGRRVPLRVSSPNHLPRVVLVDLDGRVLGRELDVTVLPRIVAVRGRVAAWAETEWEVELGGAMVGHAADVHELGARGVGEAGFSLRAPALHADTDLVVRLAGRDVLRAALDEGRVRPETVPLADGSLEWLVLDVGRLDVGAEDGLQLERLARSGDTDAVEDWLAQRESAGVPWAGDLESWWRRWRIDRAGSLERLLDRARRELNDGDLAASQRLIDQAVDSPQWLGADGTRRLDDLQRDQQRALDAGRAAALADLERALDDLDSVAARAALRSFETLADLPGGASREVAAWEYTLQRTLDAERAVDASERALAAGHGDEARHLSVEASEALGDAAAVHRSRRLDERLTDLEERLVSDGGRREDPGHERRSGSDLQPAADLAALFDRVAYRELGAEDVEALVEAVQARWPDALEGFTFSRVERFGSKTYAHRMSIWLHDATNLEFVLVPGGTTRVGSPARERDRDRDEDQYEVTLAPMLVARLEVTEATYRGGGSRRPAVRVSWADADAWCRKQGLELPTEFQWEHAARGGRSTAFATGSKLDLGDANVGRKSPGPRTVGSYDPNGFGLHDVHGNVWEWCRDGYLERGEALNDVDGLRSSRGALRVVRGGAFGRPAEHARCASRAPEGADQRTENVGFRPVLTLRP